MGIQGSVAQDISEKVGLSAAVVQSFLALSKPVRQQVGNILRVQKATLQVAKARALSFATRGDIYAERLNRIGSVAVAAMQSIQRVLNIVPLDSVIKESPELSSLLQEITGAVPLSIPVTWATAIIGIGGFDFFDGITSFRDLTDKVDELRFRAARAIALSAYAQTGNSYIDNQMNKIDKYIDIIDLIEGNL